jgi:hypothetical protein
MSESSLTAPSLAGSHQGNLLNSAVRRDIADLNRLFLNHALDPVHRGDSWFDLPAATVQQFERAPPDALERAVCMPIALFQLVLPDPGDAADWRMGAVGDAERHPGDHARGEIRRSFGLVALGVVRRLAEGVPLAARIAFGLPASMEHRLSSLSPSEAFRLASWQGLVRPRWPSHARFWNMLAGAAAGSCKEDLFWAYSAGLCLLGQCERAPPTVRYAGTERRPRPTHRRTRSKVPDVPC